jgi:hypothetical protein
MKWTDIPWDFILDKIVYKPEELQRCFAYDQGWKIFGKDDPSHLGTGTAQFCQAKLVERPNSKFM